MIGNAKVLQKKIRVSHVLKSAQIEDVCVCVLGRLLFDASLFLRSQGCPEGVSNLHGQFTFENAFNGLVCGADGFCASVVSDCDANTQCPAVAGLKTFCTDRPAVAGTTVSSSITD